MHAKVGIKIVPIGEVEQDFLQEFREGLSKVVGCKFIIGEKVDLPKNAFNRFRQQYRSEQILDMLRKLGVVLGITHEDMYADGLNFVFGQAEFEGPALISTARLNPSFYGDPENFRLMLERAIKEAVHELGHVFGLEHCKKPECAMHFSNSISDVDLKSKYFCSKCKSILGGLTK
jgi:archaemetzincin